MHPDVAETAVVGYPHSIKGEGQSAWLILGIKMYMYEYTIFWTECLQPRV